METLRKLLLDILLFIKKYRKVIKRRMSEMYFKFGYALRRHEKKIEAFLHFVNSLKCYYTLKKKLFLRNKF